MTYYTIGESEQHADDVREALEDERDPEMRRTSTRMTNGPGRFRSSSPPSRAEGSTP